MEREFYMTPEQRARLEELWNKCTDLTQPLSEQELQELVKLEEMEADELAGLEV